MAFAIFAQMVSRKRHGSPCPLRRPAGFSTWWPDGSRSTKRLRQSVSGRFIIFASLGQRGLERKGLKNPAGGIDACEWLALFNRPFIPIDRGIDLRANHVIKDHAYRDYPAHGCHQFLRALLFTGLRQKAGQQSHDPGVPGRPTESLFRRLPRFGELPLNRSGQERSPSGTNGSCHRTPAPSVLRPIARSYISAHKSVKP